MFSLLLVLFSAAPGAVGAPGVPQPQNTGLAVPAGRDMVHQTGPWTVFVDPGYELFARDGRDGSVVDIGYHVTTYTSNIQINGPEALITTALLSVRDHYALFSVDEFELGGDVNGNGSPGDPILVVHDLASGVTRSLDVAAFGDPLDQRGTRFLFRVPEFVEGDLDADGDAEDFVVFAYDHATGELVNTGLATSPGGQALLQPYGALVSVDEAAQGGTDLNLDGALSNSLMTRIDIPSLAVEYLASGYGIDYGREASLIGRTEQGIDLNGDGYAFDFGLVYSFDAAGLPTEYVGEFAAGMSFLAAGDYAALLLSSPDVDGDGAPDPILNLWDPATETLTSTGVQAQALWTAVSDGAESWLVLARSESDLGQDVNLDGDMADTFLYRWTRSTGALALIPYVATDVRAEGPTLAFVALSGVGAANRVPAGTVIVVDVPTLARTAIDWGTGLAAWELTGRRVYALVPEAAGGDGNQDGDVADTILFAASVAPAALGHSTNLGLAVPVSSFPILDPSRDFDAGHAAVLVYEQEQGQQDLDGDGDTFDYVLHVVR